MNTTQVKDFEDRNAHLADLIRSLAGKSFKYFCNAGNAGDGLIASATYQLFRHYNCQVEYLNTAQEAKSLRNETVFMAGGGNLVPLYHGMENLLKILIPNNNRIIILPHSVRGNEGILQSLSSESVVYCREPVSFDHVAAHAKCEVVLSHDIALFLDLEELDATPFVSSEGEVLFQKHLRERTNIDPDKMRGRSYFCFRRGVESASVPKAHSYDISIVFQTPIQPGQAEKGAWMLAEFARRAGKITTNRLHVGVGSAIVGTETDLYDNNYGKVSGIFEHSMAGRYGNVKFVGEPVRGDFFMRRAP